jgi:hypothetical protein
MSTVNDALDVDPTGIPPELRERRQWVAWRIETPMGRKPTKIPYNPKSQQKAKTNKPSTWGTFKEALRRHREGYNGVGYVFAADDEYFGIDLDACRSPETGELTPWARRIVMTFVTYTEVSPSGFGVKLTAKGTLPLNGDKTGKTRKLKDVPTFGDKAPEIAIYDRGRFWAYTGQRHPGAPETIEYRQSEVDEFWLKLWPTRSAPVKVGDGEARTLPNRCEVALQAMLQIRHPDANDGSLRLFMACCRAVELGLTNEEAVRTIRKYELMSPFPSRWTDSEILQRLRDAERKVARGSVKRIKIDASCKDLVLVSKQAWSGIEASNQPEELFRYGGLASRIEEGDTGEPIIRSLDYHLMRHELARRAAWYELKKVGEQVVESRSAPPRDVVFDVLATPNMPLPPLSRIVEAPVFAEDGTFQTEPGYHAGNRTLYIPAAGFHVPEVAIRPSPAEIEQARGLICFDLLGDFPFTRNSELAHAVALVLLPFARDLIAGPTPLHLIEKPSPGTGATLFVDMAMLPTTGRSVTTMTEGRDEDEWRKRLTAKLRSGSAFLLIDNLRRCLDSAAVASAITSPTWEDRVLGTSEVIRIPVRCAWIATGNNPAISSEIARRTIRIRMDARQDRPWLRTDFRHPDLRAWARSNREKLVWAALTLIRAWLEACRPQGSQTLGMFEDWAKTMGGILDCAGVPGFLENLTEFYDGSDTDGVTWKNFVAAWWGRFADQEVKVAELFGLINDTIMLPLGDKSEQSQKIRLGKLLSDNRDRTFTVDTAQGERLLRLTRGEARQRSYLWRLKA